METYAWDYIAGTKRKRGKKIVKSSQDYCLECKKSTEGKLINRRERELSS